ncbi:MAG: CPP1-like family protein [Pseudanabaenaceae cyanobacterium]|jgi:hypothetical protein
MSNPTPYERLGVSEDASFEEVRDARDRMFRDHEGDEAAQEKIEAAYDAILMDRLRARKEGKITVPDRIRFPERLSSALPTNTPTATNRRSINWLGWLNGLLVRDQPSLQEIGISGGIFTGLIALSGFVPTAATTWLAVGVLASIVWIGRKENRYGRGMLLSFAGVVVGVSISALLLQLLAAAGVTVPGFPSLVQTAMILFVMWLWAAFLR